MYFHLYLFVIFLLHVECFMTISKSCKSLQLPRVKFQKLSLSLESSISSESTESSKSLQIPEKSTLGIYLNSLRSHPLLTKSIASGIGFTIGDVIAQKIAKIPSWNSLRTLRFALFGILIHAPAGQFVYRYIQNLIPGVTPKDVLKKVCCLFH